MNSLLILNTLLLILISYTIGYRLGNMNYKLNTLDLTSKYKDLKNKAFRPKTIVLESKDYIPDTED